MKDKNFKRSDIGFFEKHRISWQAILAGVSVAVGVQLFFSLLGIGIGASTVDPLSESRPFESLGIGAALWMGISCIISLGVGGWVAGRTATTLSKTLCSLHGFVTWCVATALSLYFLTTSVGGVLGGSANVFGRSLLQMGEVSASGASQTMNNLPVSRMLNNLLTGNDQALRNTARETAITYLMNSENLSRTEAEARIVQLQSSIATTGETASQNAREMGDKVATGVARASLWGSVFLLLGAISATVAGSLAGRKEADLYLEAEEESTFVRNRNAPLESL